MDMKRKLEITILMDNVINTSLSSSPSSSEIDWNSSSLYNTSSSSEEDAEYLLLFPLIRYLINGCKRNRVENYINIVDSWTDLEFKEHLRIQRTTANQLIGNFYLKK